MKGKIKIPSVPVNSKINEEKKRHSEKIQIAPTSMGAEERLAIAFHELYAMREKMLNTTRLLVRKVEGVDDGTELFGTPDSPIGIHSVIDGVRSLIGEIQETLDELHNYIDNKL